MHGYKWLVSPGVNLLIFYEKKKIELLKVEINHLKLSPTVFASYLSEKIHFFSKIFYPCPCELKTVKVCLKKTTFRVNYLQEIVVFNSEGYFLII